MVAGRKLFVLETPLKEQQARDDTVTEPHSFIPTLAAPYLTPFIGRQTEVDGILRLLQDPNCQLLTLVGVGGTGKTRLALQVATHLHAAGYHLAIVDLQPVPSADLLAVAIIDAVGLPRKRAEEPARQLVHGLQARELVLVLDNFEHLLDGVDLISELLAAAPHVTMLVTSRVVLGLQEEWLYPVGGLHFPDASSTPAEAESLAGYDAVNLFVTCARRVRPDFQLESEAEGVVRLCRTVEGMPLAIELAAAWAGSLTATAIADEIERDLDFLATPRRNVAAKHRSIQIVFQRTWQLLTPEERAVFKRLSVFRGGFDRAAAEYVAGASLATLAGLVDKSLLRRGAGGRYEIHELLRQYAEEQLAQTAADQVDAHDRHSSYYADFLYEQINELTTQQRGALARTATELDNIRVAWQWATRQAKLADLARAAMAFFAFCQGQSRYREGVEALAAAFHALADLPTSPTCNQTCAELLTGRGWLELRLGRIDQAAQALEMAATFYETGDLLPVPVMGSDPAAALPLVAVIRGDYAGAEAAAERAWQSASARNDPANLALTGYSRTSAAIALGKYSEALQYAEDTLALTKAVGNQWFLAYVYNHLGEATQALGERAAAKEYYKSSYAIRQEFADPEGMAVALNHLGELALLDHDFAQARDLYQQSLAIYQEIGDQGGLVQALQGLGLAAWRLDDEAQARHHLQRALQLAATAQLTPLVLSVIVEIGLFLLEDGLAEQGWSALAFAFHHPATDQATRVRVQASLSHYRSSANLVDSAHAEQPADQSSALDALVSALTTTLALSSAETGQAATPPDEAQESPPPPAHNALSERELEVLRLLAAGHSNQEIANALVVTLSTVKAHCNNIYSKLDVRNRLQAIGRARELGLLS
ncbi:MAG: hypothetical protein DCC55_15215 [Chloroflexi bacterium]|nr:MAG: hypothetical protein DCC55_15215 [Chloroflexota bacterium]